MELGHWHEMDVDESRIEWMNVRCDKPALDDDTQMHTRYRVGTLFDDANRLELLDRATADLFGYLTRTSTTQGRRQVDGAVTAGHVRHIDMSTNTDGQSPM